MSHGLELKLRISEKIIESALRMYDRVLVCFSGGKDSTLVTYLVAKVCDKHNLPRPMLLIGDPFPFEENMEFCRRVARQLGWSEWIEWPDLLDDTCKDFCVTKTGDKQTCCLWNKVYVLNRLIDKEAIECVITGIRWDEHPARAEDCYFRVIDQPRHVRCEPILHWTWEDVLRFYLDHPDLLNPLYLKGYTSLGCKHCTSRSLDIEFEDPMEYIAYVLARKNEGLQERAGRDIDKERIMERLRQLGYF